MARVFDHLVIGTRDLDATAAVFTALGFSVGARNRHPWGTENRLVQFSDETFLELISVADAALIPPHLPKRFSFGAHVRDALAGHAGMSMLALKGSDARKDAADFAHAHIGDFEPFDFARKGKRPDGTEIEVAFSLAFARDNTMPDCAFFTCQHHFAQNFWSKPAQTHANGALGISRVTILADNPSDHHIFLSEFIGERRMRSTSFGIESEAGASVDGHASILEIVSREGFAFRYGQPARVTTTPYFAGIVLQIDQLSTLLQVATAGKIALHAHSGALVLNATPDCGTVLLFEGHKP